MIKKLFSKFFSKMKTKEELIEAAPENKENPLDQIKRDVTEMIDGIEGAVEKNRLELNQSKSRELFTISKLALSKVSRGAFVYNFSSIKQRFPLQDSCNELDFFNELDSLCNNYADSLGWEAVNDVLHSIRMAFDSINEMNEAECNMIKFELQRIFNR